MENTKNKNMLKLKYGEETVMFSCRVPESKKSEISKIVKLKLNEYEKNAILEQSENSTEDIQQKAVVTHVPPGVMFVSNDPPEIAKNVETHKIHVETTEFDVTIDQIYDLVFVSKLPDLEDLVVIDKKQITMCDKYNNDVFYVKWDDKILKFDKKEEFLRFCKDQNISLK